MRSVRAEVSIRATGKDALDGFLHVEWMKAWWGVNRGLVDPRKGGVWAATWDSEGQAVWTGRIKTINRREGFALDNVLYFDRRRPIFGPMTLAFAVREGAGRSRLRVVQDGYGEGPDWDWYYNLVATNWPLALEKLRVFLESR
jgi:hypothetical protein